MMELLCKNSLLHYLLTNFATGSIKNIWQGYKHASDSVPLEKRIKFVSETVKKSTSSRITYIRSSNLFLSKLILICLLSLDFLVFLTYQPFLRRPTGNTGPNSGTPKFWFSAILGRGFNHLEGHEKLIM